MKDPRIEALFNEALTLFIDKGYARMHVSDLAKAAKISVGAVYMLFSGKRAVFDFVLKGIADPSFIERDFSFPIDESVFAGLDDEIIQRLHDETEAFEAHLDDLSYGFCDMVDDAFDIIARYAPAVLVFQNNGDDCGVLYPEYVEFRSRFCRDVESYLSAFVERGSVRSVDPMVLHARLIIETISWWAIHIRYDAFEKNAAVTLEKSKALVLDALSHAYLK